MKLCLLSIFGLVSVLSAWCQKPPTMPTFQIGMTMAQVHSRFGLPSSYFSNGHYYSSFPAHAHVIVWEVYKRRVHGREYEVLIESKPDENGPRLHPVFRASEVRFHADKPVPVRVMLSDLPEASQFCHPECRVSVFELYNAAPSMLRVLSPDGDRRPELEFSYTNVSRTQDSPVQSLDDLASEATMIDYKTTEKYQTGEGKMVGFWPERSAQ